MSIIGAVMMSARAIRWTLSYMAGSAGRRSAGAAMDPWPEWSPAAAEACPVRDVAVWGCSPAKAVRRAVMLSPAFADQVRPEAERNMKAANRTVPVVPCSQTVRARPVAGGPSWLCSLWRFVCGGSCRSRAADRPGRPPTARMLPARCRSGRVRPGSGSGAGWRSSSASAAHRCCHRWEGPRGFPPCPDQRTRSCTGIHPGTGRRTSPGWCLPVRGPAGL